MSKQLTKTKESPKKVLPAASRPSSKDAHSPTPELIAAKAYELWQRRGCMHGTDQQDWFEAETELLAVNQHARKG
jgi:hypothetical protein